MSEENLHQLIFEAQQEHPIEPVYVVPVASVESFARKIRKCPNGCTRSHPHEDMDAECVQKTEVARLNNWIARYATQEQP